jgi:hypothetical protein
MSANCVHGCGRFMALGHVWYGGPVRHGGCPEPSEGHHMATIPEMAARIHALWAKGDVRTREESVELGRLLAALEAEWPPGDFYRHILDVLHIPTRAAQDLMQQARASEGADSGQGL